MKIKLVVLDLDGTTVGENSWRKLNAAMGVTPGLDRHYYNLYHRGRITYPAWINALVRMFHRRGDPTKDNIFRILLNYSLYPGVREVVNELKARGIHVVIISGAMDIFVKAVAEDLGIETAAYNTTFVFDDSDRLVRAETEGEEALVKLAQLRAICQNLNIAPDECICVGDGPNDLLIFAYTGLGVTFDRCLNMHPHCWRCIPDWSHFLKLLH